MVNKVILIGNVGVDPEVRTLESGAKVARVRLATTERLFDRQANETKEHTEWHTITTPLPHPHFRYWLQNDLRSI